MTKILIDRAVVEQALEALEAFLSDELRPYEAAKTATNVRAALAEPVQRKEHCLWARNGNEPCPHVQQAEPVQEPVATKNENGITLHSQWDSIAPGSKLYTAPPHRKPLTEEEIMQCFDEAVADYVDVSDAEMVDFARAIERAHGIKE